MTWMFVIAGIFVWLLLGIIAVILVDDIIDYNVDYAAHEMRRSEDLAKRCENEGDEVNAARHWKDVSYWAKQGLIARLDMFLAFAGGPLSFVVFALLRRS